MADEITTPGEGQLRALFVLAGNPVLSSVDGPALAAALEQLDLMVALDLYVNETNRHADYVLPAATWLERADVPFAIAAFLALFYPIAWLALMALLAGIPAIIIGLKARKQIAASHGGESGDGMAITGIALGALMTLVSAVGLVVLLITLVAGVMGTSSSPAYIY